MENQKIRLKLFINGKEIEHLTDIRFKGYILTIRYKPFKDSVGVIGETHDLRKEEVSFVYKNMVNKNVKKYDEPYKPKFDEIKDMFQ